jgi:protein SCO1/2
MKSIHYFLLGLATALGLVVVVGAAWLTRSYAYQGSLINPPLPVAGFRLTGQDGQPVDFEALRGAEERRVVLIFFGYTRCPDVCPVTLTEYQKVKVQLKDRASQVRFVFITVDPERDTPEILGRHLANFDPSFVGLTGSQAELEPVWKAFGVGREIDETGSAAGYLVSHTSRIYVIDRSGQLRLTYAFGTAPEVIVQDVEQLLKEK